MQGSVHVSCLGMGPGDSTKCTVTLGRIGRVEQPEAYMREMVHNELLSWRRRVSDRATPTGHETLDAASPVVEDPSSLVEQLHSVWGG